MRSLIVAVSVLVVALVAGCSSSPATPWTATTTPAGPSVHQVRVYLTPNAGQQEQQAIRDKLEAMSGVRQVVFQTAEQNYQEAKKDFANDPNIVGTLRPQDFTDAFAVVVDDTAAAGRVTSAVRGMPGVRTVSTASPPSAQPTR